jgi:hypothetical protein
VVAGSVAVDRRGARVGKGGGYSDLEYAIARTVGAIDRRTVMATTVHSVQLRPPPLPTTAHDFFLDLIVTPDEILRPKHPRQPRGILVNDLRPEHRQEVPCPRRSALTVYFVVNDHSRRNGWPARVPASATLVRGPLAQGRVRVHHDLAARRPMLAGSSGESQMWGTGAIFSSRSSCVVMRRSEA